MSHTMHDNDARSNHPEAQRHGLNTANLQPAEVALLRAMLAERSERMLAAMEDEFDDPEYRGHHAPLVKQPDAPLRDGRRPASRRRRLAAGALDLATCVVPLALGAAAGVHPAVLIVLHLLATVVPTTLVGCTAGKLILGMRVVELSTLRSPSIARSVARWALPFAPVMAALVLGLAADGAGLLMLLVYMPIMFDLRGFHDRISGTTVVRQRTFTRSTTNTRVSPPLMSRPAPLSP